MASIAHGSYRIRGNSLNELPGKNDLRQLMYQASQLLGAAAAEWPLEMVMDRMTTET